MSIGPFPNDPAHPIMRDMEARRAAAHDGGASFEVEGHVMSNDEYAAWLADLEVTKRRNHLAHRYPTVEQVYWNLLKDYGKVQTPPWLVGGGDINEDEMAEHAVAAMFSVAAHLAAALKKSGVEPDTSLCDQVTPNTRPKKRWKRHHDQAIVESRFAEGWRIAERVGAIIDPDGSGLARHPVSAFVLHADGGLTAIQGQMSNIRGAGTVVADRDRWERPEAMPSTGTPQGVYLLGTVDLAKPHLPEIARGLAVLARDHGWPPEAWA